MNRGDAPMPDWNNPNWTPPSYPGPSELPGGVPGDPAIDKLFQERADAAKAEGLKLWPTQADFLKSTYDTDLVDSPILKYLEPRRIVPPGGFPSPKCVAAGIYSTMSEVMMKYHGGMTVAPTEISAMLLTYAVLAARVPIFYVQDDFARAVAATELPGDFTLQDLNWPMPAMVLGFSTKFLKEYTGRDIGYILAAELAEGDHEPPVWTRNLPTIKCPPKMVFQFHTYNGVLESYVTSWMKRDRVSETVTKYKYTDYTHATEAKVEDDRVATERIGTLLLKLLTVLNIRPNLVTPHKIQRPGKVNKRTGNVDRTELWSPNFIGFDYRPVRQEGTGTHASPRWHWRRGHITHQRTGALKDPGFVSVASLPRIADGEHKGEVDWLAVSDETRAAFWRCHKKLWIEPTLINFDEPEEAPAAGASA